MASHDGSKFHDTKETPLEKPFLAKFAVVVPK
jgi:hypothetical protein